MKGYLRVCWMLSLVLCGGLALGQSGVTQREVVVRKVSIQHVGPPAVSDDLIRGNIRLVLGKSYSSIALSDATSADIRNLLATGFFRDVTVAVDQFQDGMEVIYQVEGKPVLTEVEFVGNTKYSRRKLLRKVSSKVGEPLDEYKLFTDKLEIEKYYQKAGYYNTQVRYSTVLDQQRGKGVATFEIIENPKVRIKDVEFVGATAFSQAKLRRTIKTRRWWMFSWLTRSGKLKEDQLDEDKISLIQFYQEEGYIDFEIRDLKIDMIDPKHMIVRFTVFEGRQYRVGKVVFEGNEVFSDEDIRNGTRVISGAELRTVRPRMLEGEVFTPGRLEQDIREIEDFYGASGYIGEGARGRITVRSIKTPNVEQGTMDLTYQIVEGEPSRVEKIKIEGNTKTKDKVLRRELAISPGEVFNMVRVQISEQRLRGMQFFSRVETEVEPTEVPNRKNLVINVEEGPSGNVSLGAGFSSIESLFGYLRLTQGNFDLFNPPAFTGAGQKLQLTLTVGTRQELYEVRFVEPWFLERKLELGVDLYHRNIGYYSDVYDQTETGARIGLRKPLWRQRLIGGVNYTIENIGIDFEDRATSTNYSVAYGPGRDRQSSVMAPQVSPELAEEEGDWLVSKMGFLLAYDTRGPGLLPSRGQRTAIVPQIAGGVLGADVDYFKLELETGWYFPGFFKGHVLEIGGKIGTISSYGRSDRTHIWDRYYLGGAYTLRGYKYKDVGPKDSLGEPIGGDSYWMATAEYSLPTFVPQLRLAAFYDVGVVNADDYDFDPARYHDNWGVGIRLDIPQLGMPIRLDYGFPIRYGPDTDGDPRFQFSVGYNRPI